MRSQTNKCDFVGVGAGRFLFVAMGNKWLKTNRAQSFYFGKYIFKRMRDVVDFETYTSISAKFLVSIFTVELCVQNCKMKNSKQHQLVLQLEQPEQQVEKYPIAEKENAKRS